MVESQKDEPVVIHVEWFTLGLYLSLPAKTSVPGSFLG